MLNVEQGVEQSTPKQRRPGTLERALPMVAKTLGDKLGVQVRIGGGQACTNGSTIWVPSLPPEDDQANALAWGYIAHESAHVKFTEFSLDHGLTPVGFGILNAIEDARIEIALQEVYPGTRRWLDDLYRNLTPNIQVCSEDHPARILGVYVITRVMSKALSRPMGKLPETADQAIKDAFPKGVITRLKALLSEVPSLGSTKEALALTKRILAMLQQEQEKEQQQGNDSSDADDSDQGEDSSESASRDAGNSASDQDDADDSSDAGKGGQGEDISESECGDAGNGVGDQHANDSSDADEGGQGQDSSDQSGGHGAGKHVIKEALDASDEDVEQGFHERAKQALDGAADEDLRHTEIPATCHSDKAKEKGISSQLMQVRATSNRLRSRLQGLIQARRPKPFAANRGRRVESQRLAKLATGNSRIFRKEFDVDKPDTAIHLLVDNSGSMDCIQQVANQAAMALGLALEPIQGVETAISYFPGRSFTEVMEVVSFGEKIQPNSCRFNIRSTGGTPMAEALIHAAQSLAPRREKRKVVIALTDGGPNDGYATQYAVRMLRRSGVEVIGIGIGMDLVQHYFPKWGVINSVDELQQALFDLAETILLD